MKVLFLSATLIFGAQFAQANSVCTDVLAAIDAAQGRFDIVHPDGGYQYGKLILSNKDSDPEGTSYEYDYVSFLEGGANVNGNEVNFAGISKSEYGNYCSIIIAANMSFGYEHKISVQGGKIVLEAGQGQPMIHVPSVLRPRN